MDRVALTARQTLRDRLGYEGVLLDLARSDYYRLAIADKAEQALSYVRTLVSQTAVFVNPTKETARVALFTRPLSQNDTYVALVYPREGLYDDRLCRRLVFDLGYDNVVAAGRGVAWYLTLNPGASRSLVEDILVTRRRDQGLLVNPHAEDFEIV